MNGPARIPIEILKPGLWYGRCLWAVNERGREMCRYQFSFRCMARAAGVPAQEVFGIRMGKKDREDITIWQHCWAEFFLPGYGWEPVDAADVCKAMLINGRFRDIIH